MNQNIVFDWPSIKYEGRERKGREIRRYTINNQAGSFVNANGLIQSIITVDFTSPLFLLSWAAQIRLRDLTSVPIFDSDISNIIIPKLTAISDIYDPSWIVGLNPDDLPNRILPHSLQKVSSIEISVQDDINRYPDLALYLPLVAGGNLESNIFLEIIVCN